MPMKPDDLRAAGDWIKQLKVILGQGAKNVANRPESAHRSTKKAVNLLLSNLKAGAGKTRDDATTEKEIEQVVFNAVDQLMSDKMDKSGKTKLQALAKFKEVLGQRLAAQSKKRKLDDQWQYKIEDALRALRYEEMEKLFRDRSMPAKDLLDTGVLEARPHLRGEILRAVDRTTLDEGKKAVWLQEAENHFRSGGITPEDMLSTDQGRDLLAAVPHLRGDVLSSVDPAYLDGLDLDAIFGPAKDDVLAEALLSMGKRQWPLNRDGKVDRVQQFDPAAFSKLKVKVSAAKWNDKRRGLGPQVCQGLWKNGNYDQIAELIRYDVDTSLAARVTGNEIGKGVWSGFFQPIQHVVSNQLRDVSLVDADPPWEDYRKQIAKGAQKVLAALEAKGTAVTLTKWSDVTGSEMITEFKAHPGTIWGFEDVRMPYVQAAHETDQGVQPLRMMELWEAVIESLTPEAYDALLAKPDVASKKFIEAGVAKIELGLTSTDPKTMAKYAEIKRDSKTYIANFERDAKAFLAEFAAQMPKGTFISPSLDDSGKARKDAKGKAIAVSDVAGVGFDKFMSGIACKAGLWWAKNEKKPVYYCLDGINMDDVTNYKAVKNTAIADFITNGGKAAGAKGHDEVITLVELREVLKNWGELEGTVKFVQKGVILKDPDLTQKVADWRKKMKKANTDAGRTPAPDRAVFANELNAIDPGLMAKLSAGAKGDMDARDIVKKFGFLQKVAKTRPQIVLQYIMSRCTVLTEYGLIPAKLPELAAAVKTANNDEIADLSAELLDEIKRCHVKFQAPLEAALIRHPDIARAGLFV